jgi:DNA polymerase III subunit beta
MKIQLLKENLHRAATLAARFATGKAQLPVLSQVVIEAKKEGVYFWATDLEMGVRVRVGAKVLEPGEMALPARVLAELAGSLPLGPVELSGSGEEVLVVAGPVKAQIQGMSAADFPRFGEGQGLASLQRVPLSLLERVVGRVTFAVSTDESRPVLTGMLWELPKGTVVATDGYRLSRLKKAFAPINDGVERLVVQGSLLREAVHCMGELGEKEVGISYDEAKQQVVIVGEDVLVMGRVLGGEFPEYRAILPSDPELVAVFGRDELMRAIKTAAIFARESAHIVKLSLADGKAVLSANAPQVGSNSIELGVELKRGSEGAIAFNGKYVMDLLSHLEADRVEFGMSGPLKPGLWSEVGDEAFAHVIMPVRLRGEGE